MVEQASGKRASGQWAKRIKTLLVEGGVGLKSHELFFCVLAHILNNRTEYPPSVTILWAGVMRLHYSPLQLTNYCQGPRPEMKMK